jgi:hypothetical protein
VPYGHIFPAVLLRPAEQAPDRPRQSWRQRRQARARARFLSTAPVDNFVDNCIAMVRRDTIKCMKSKKIPANLKNKSLLINCLQILPGHGQVQAFYFQREKKCA